LMARGVPARDLQEEFRWVNGGHLLHPAPSGLIGLGVSRPLLEAAVRARVRALPNVTFHEATDATGLAATPDGGRITGLRVLGRDTDGGERVLPADLVVDASGRGTRAPQWLTALGYPAPAVEQLPIGLAYASRSYRRDPEGPDGAAVAGTAAVPRGGVMIAQEDDRWIVSFGGILGDAAPLDDAGYTAFAATLPSPVIHEVIRDAEPLSDPLRFRYPASTRRRYERLGRLPAGFLAFGDSICSFDPVYGQGMTVASLEALVLRRCLEDGGRALAGQFFPAAARIIAGPWDIAVGGDLRFPGVVGPRTAKVRAVNAYLERLHAAAERDPEVGRAFLRVVNLVDPPQALLHPRTVGRVLAAGRRPAHRGAGGAAAAA
jgi:2-polyprenyl-6-methoxyphenol hydroxylase-like FAD-dependent oxidoreductase